MLSDIIGLDYSIVHEEACKLEHVFGDAIEERLTVLLNSAQLSPYGCPIPSLEGELHPEVFREGVVALAEVVTGEVQSFNLVRLSEFVQADEMALTGLKDVGVVPDVAISAVEVHSAVEIRGPEGRVRVDKAIAGGLWVADKEAVAH